MLHDRSPGAAQDRTAPRFSPHLTFRGSCRHSRTIWYVFFLTRADFAPLKVRTNEYGVAMKPSLAMLICVAAGASLVVGCASVPKLAPSPPMRTPATLESSRSFQA